jgi:hypothetical protein
MRPIFDDQSKGLDRFGLLLVLMVSTVSVLGLVDLTADLGSWTSGGLLALANVVVAAMFLVALRAAGLRRAWQLVVDVLVIVLTALVVLAVAVLSATGHHVEVAASAPAGTLLLAVAIPIVIIRRLVRHRTVSYRTLLGAITAYLAIPVAFFYVFLAIDRAAGSFFGSPQPSTSFMYFSLTNLSTLGLGDLSAATRLGQLLTAFEAIIGQVFLVTFVAMIVGMWVGARKRSLTDAADGDE